MRFRHVCLGLGMLAAVPGTAVAQDEDEKFGAAGYDTAPSSNIYVEGRAALVFLTEQDVSGAINGDVQSDPGFGGSLTVGYHLFENFRVEFEGTLDVHDVDEATPLSPQLQQRVASNPRVSADDVAGQGDTITLGAFGNGYYDFDTGTAFTPYIGAGFGVLRIDAEYESFGLNDKDHVPAYQGMVGVSWHVTRQTALTLGYRYRAALTDPEFGAPAGDIETEYANHGAHLGLRYRF